MQRMKKIWDAHQASLGGSVVPERLLPEVEAIAAPVLKSLEKQVTTQLQAVYQQIMENSAAELHKALADKDLAQQLELAAAEAQAEIREKQIFQLQQQLQQQLQEAAAKIDSLREDHQRQQQEAQRKLDELHHKQQASVDSASQMAVELAKAQEKHIGQNSKINEQAEQIKRSQDEQSALQSRNSELHRQVEQLKEAALSQAKAHAVELQKAQAEAKTAIETTNQIRDRLGDIEMRAIKAEAQSSSFEALYDKLVIAVSEKIGPVNTDSNALVNDTKTQVKKQTIKRKN